MPVCRYSPAFLRNGQWNCEVLVGNEVFRTVRECGRLDEAQNTAAHIALHSLLMTESVDHAAILPTNSDLLPELNPRSQMYKFLKLSGDPPVFRFDFQTGYQPAKAVFPPVQLPSVQNVSQRGKKKKNKNDDPPPPPAKKQKTNTSQQPQQKGNDEISKNPNYVPLTNSRLMEIEIEEVVEDKLETMKAVQARLDQLGSSGSFYSLMKGNSANPPP